MGITEFITFLFIGIGLSFDSFAVSVTCGLIRQDMKFTQAVPIAGSLAFFQTLFPAVGWIIGHTLQGIIHSVDHWLALILLSALGIKMIIEGSDNDSTVNNFDPFRKRVILGLSVATSIDALVVGFSFGFLTTSVLLPITLIGLVTFIASMLGILFGKNIPAKRSRQSMILGGIILIFIGIKILIEHLWF
jgi:putative Mn2+ efflux pump MntP